MYSIENRKNIEKYKDIVLDNLDACSLDQRLRRKMVNGYCEGFNCGGCRERVLEWLLEECKEPVLDDAERKYLSEVIRPFREKIKDKDGFRDSLNLPDFENDTMYKGMEINKAYTLEELGL